MYPGLTNTRVELRKIVRSSCFMILRIHFITTRKIQEIALQGFQISKFSWGSMPPDPPKWLAPSARDCSPPQLQSPGAATAKITLNIFTQFISSKFSTSSHCEKKYANISIIIVMGFVYVFCYLKTLLKLSNLLVLQ